MYLNRDFTDSVYKYHIRNFKKAVPQVYICKCYKFMCDIMVVTYTTPFC